MTRTFCVFLLASVSIMCTACPPKMAHVHGGARSAQVWAP